MTLRRWIADEVSGNHAALTGEHADHLIRVLRASVGQEFDIATGSAVRRGRIVSIADRRVEFELGEQVPSKAPADVTILMAVFKFDRMEWAIEKCTELGVTRIIPVVAQRTDSHLASAATKRAERWRRVALQSAEQSRRSHPPEIAEPVDFVTAAKLAGELRIVLSEAEERNLLRDVVSPRSGDVLLAVGPEGGWAPQELNLFHEAGWISASLGPTILRAETAAIAATAIILSELA